MMASIALMLFSTGLTVRPVFTIHGDDDAFHQSYLGPREWSPLARWTFREFNEVRKGEGHVVGTANQHTMGNDYPLASKSSR